MGKGVGHRPEPSAEDPERCAVLGCGRLISKSNPREHRRGLGGASAQEREAVRSIARRNRAEQARLNREARDALRILAESERRAAKLTLKQARRERNEAQIEAKRARSELKKAILTRGLDPFLALEARVLALETALADLHEALSTPISYRRLVDGGSHPKDQRRAIARRVKEILSNAVEDRARLSLGADRTTGLRSNEGHPRAYRRSDSRRVS